MHRNLANHIAAPLAGLLLASIGFSQSTEPVSVSFAGTFGNGASASPAIQAGGRFIYFESDASNLVAGDLNGATDIYRRDVASGETTLISTPMSGAGTPNGASQALDYLPGDYQWVVFQSDASDLVSGDTNGVADIFLAHIALGTIERISVTSTGAQATAASERPRFSADGSFVAFESDAALVPSDLNGLRDIYLLSLSTGDLELMSVTGAGVQGNGPSYDVSRPRFSLPNYPLSLTFSSDASNLVPSDTNGVTDIFAKEGLSGQLTRLSVGLNGVQADGPSAQSEIYLFGGGVVYSSLASNLVTGDTNQDWDLFFVNPLTGVHERLNVTSNGGETSGLVVERPAVRVIGQQFDVSFSSSSPALVSGDTNGATDVFLRSHLTGVIERVSLADDGGQLNGDSLSPSVDWVLGTVAFESAATNVTVGGTPGAGQLYVRQSGATSISNYCLAAPNASGAAAGISATGSAFLPDNDLVLEATQMPFNAFAFFLVSTEQAFIPNPGGSAGNLCLSGSIGRFVGPGQIQNSGAAGTVSIAVDNLLIPSPFGARVVSPGETLNFQAWMRDRDASGQPTSNFTNGVSVTLF